MGDESDPDVLAAQATLQQAVDVRERLRPDLAYWFAELYYWITSEEIAQRNTFQAPAFVMHFIPAFYNLYAANAQLHADGRDDETAPHWRAHFTNSANVDPQDIRAYVTKATMVTVLGIRAHIAGDMTPALVQAYRSFLDANLIEAADAPLDAFKDDFFVLNRPVFEEVRRKFAAEFEHTAVLAPAGMMGYSPDSTDELLAIADMFDARLHVGLTVDSIYGLREQAWQAAKKVLGQA